MQNEIDSSNIIAALVKNIAENNFTLSYHLIRKIANRLEATRPTLLATYDLMSIDAFRCSFTHHVIMEEHQLVISNLNEIQGRLNKLLPSKDITNIIIDISKEELK